MACGRAAVRVGGEGRGGAAAKSLTSPAPGCAAGFNFWLVCFDTGKFSPPSRVSWENESERNRNARPLCSRTGPIESLEPTENAIQIWSQNPSVWVHTTYFSCFAIRREYYGRRRCARWRTVCLAGRQPAGTRNSRIGFWLLVMKKLLFAT